MARIPDQSPQRQGFGDPSEVGRPLPPVDLTLGRRLVKIAAIVVLSSAAGAAVVSFKSSAVIVACLALITTVAILLRPFWGVILYTALFIIRPAEIFPVLAPLHLERLIGALTLASMFGAQLRSTGQISIDRTRQTGLLLLFSVFVLLSVPLAYWRIAAASGFVEFLKILVFYLAVGHLVNTQKRLRVYVLAVVVLVSYTSADALFAYFAGGSFFAQGIDRAVAGTSMGDNPNELGTTLAATIPLLLLLGFHAPFGVRRFLALGGAGLMILTLAFTGSRASFLGFLGGITYLWWTSRRRVLTGLFLVLSLVVGFASLPDQYKTRYLTVTHTALDGSSRSRIEIWKKGLRMVMDRPLNGVGIGCFGTANALEYSTGLRRSWLAAHSLYIQVVAEVGLIGAIVFFGFLVELVRLNRHTAAGLKLQGHKWKYESTLLRALLAGIIVLLVSGVFGHSLLRRTWYLYGALGLAVMRIFLAEQEAPTDEVDTTGTPSQVRRK